MTRLMGLKSVQVLYDFVILRKYRIRSLLVDAMETNMTQLVSLGAGLAPAEINFVARNPTLNCTAIAVDYSKNLLASKRQIIESACPDVLPKLDFVQVDFALSEPTADARAPKELLQKVRQSPLWQEGKRAVWLLEGLVYYLSEGETVSLFETILQRGDQIILDFSRPEDAVAESDREVARVACAALARSIGREDILRMNLPKVAALSGAHIRTNETVHDIEQLRILNGLAFSLVQQRCDWRGDLHRTTERFTQCRGSGLADPLFYPRLSNVDSNPDDRFFQVQNLPFPPPIHKELPTASSTSRTLPSQHATG
ncbi:MAG: hypothetical protein MHM6MM_002876 [Cercozoa sp. M6MM]